jgi:hypothetical protein
LAAERPDPRSAPRFLGVGKRAARNWGLGMWGSRSKAGWSWRLAALLGSLVMLSGSIAVADVPDGNVINGCRNKTTGALRLIDRSAGQKCVAGEAVLSWANWKSRGLWYSTFTYHVADVVSYLGSSYVAKLAPPFGTNPPNTTYWNLVASKGVIGQRGVQGLPGVQGLTGATGPQGVAGAIGPAGPAGVQGPTGDVGPAGSQGVPGVTGATGSQGVPGVSAVPIFGKIDSAGTLLYSRHITGVSYSGALTKTYTITFDQDMSQCAVSAVSEAQTAIPVISARASTSISITFALLSGLLTTTTFDVTMAC